MRLRPKVAAKHKALITIEENVVAGGIGSAIQELLASQGMAMPVLNLGIPDRFIEHGSRSDCLTAAGLDLAGIELSIGRWWRKPAKAAGA